MKDRHCKLLQPSPESEPEFSVHSSITRGHAPTYEQPHTRINKLDVYQQVSRKSYGLWPNNFLR